jgi:hypothetical protein
LEAQKLGEEGSRGQVERKERNDSLSSGYKRMRQIVKYKFGVQCKS